MSRKKPKVGIGTSGAPQFVAKGGSEESQRGWRLLLSSPSDAEEDPVVMRDYMSVAAKCLAKDLPMDPKLRGLLAGWLGRVADGEEPSTVFGVKRGRRPKHSPLFVRGVVSMVNDLVRLRNIEDENYIGPKQQDFEVVAKALDTPEQLKLRNPLERYTVGWGAIKAIYLQAKSKKAG